MDTFFIGTSQVVTDEQIDYIKTVVDDYFDKADNVRV